MHELFEVVIYFRFAPSYNREFINEFVVWVIRKKVQWISPKVIQKIRVQVWSVNQRATEAEVTDS
jgi:hypothetical protein